MRRSKDEGKQRRRQSSLPLTSSLAGSSSCSTSALSIRQLRDLAARPTSAATRALLPSLPPKDPAVPNDLLPSHSAPLLAAFRSVQAVCSIPGALNYILCTLTEPRPLFPSHLDSSRSSAQTAHGPSSAGSAIELLVQLQVSRAKLEYWTR